MKTVLILGGNGFVGKQIVRAISLLPEYHTIALARTKPTQREKGVEYCLADVNDAESIFPLFQKADHIINASGMVSYDTRHTHELRKANVESLQTMRTVLHQTPNVQQFVHVSSCAAFGCQRGSFSENSPSHWHEKEQYLPYAYSKYLGNAIARSFPVPVSILYPPLILGPEDQKVLPSLFAYIAKSPIIFAPKGGNGIIDVRDFAQAVALVVRSNINDEYIVTENTYSFIDILQSIGKVQKKKRIFFVIPHALGAWFFRLARAFERCGVSLRSENIFFGFSSRDPDGTKIQKICHFSPKITLEQTVADFLHEREKTTLATTNRFF